ncbi:hypothetical protein O181_097348 [Austropuccinia psidii MF-1]|uniref:Uncharacterized protein n=1 Tax=Austropuccinia psidii MF-1 TaxID=1389203 RepID=A0A9Q3J7B8_9BASI|nr:hypothetical protein [Austropuccinia psidii MF-1]
MSSKFPEPVDFIWTCDPLSDLDEDDPENCQEAVAWLRSKNITPWVRVQAAWTATSKFRLRQLQIPTPAVEDETQAGPCRKKRRVGRKKAKAPEEKVSNYLREYPQLLESQGWGLVSSFPNVMRKQFVLGAKIQRLRQGWVESLKFLLDYPLFNSSF